MMDRNDWRLENPSTKFLGALLQRAVFKQHSATWDHEHCAFCWQKIAEQHIPDSVQEGYTLGDDWVCPQCFGDLAGYFNWTSA